MLTTILKLQGKGDSRADYVSIHQFDSQKTAVAFLKENNSPNEKYWTVSYIVTNGTVYETYPDSSV